MDETTTPEVVPDVTDDSPDAEIPWLGQKRHLEVPNYNPVASLLGKLERWLLLQPEWAVILAAPRQVRRQAITLIAKRLTTIPNRYENFGGPNAAN